MKTLRLRRLRLEDQRLANPPTVNQANLQSKVLDAPAFFPKSTLARARDAILEENLYVPILHMCKLEFGAHSHAPIFLSDPKNSGF